MFWRQYIKYLIGIIVAFCDSSLMCEGQKNNTFFLSFWNAIYQVVEERPILKYQSETRLCQKLRSERYLPRKFKNASGVIWPDSLQKESGMLLPLVWSENILL